MSARTFHRSCDRRFCTTIRGLSMQCRRLELEKWSIGVMGSGDRMMHYRHIARSSVFAFALFWASAAAAQEVFIGNPGKSLNFFHFDLAIERGFFRELGVEVKLLHTKCDVAVTALLTGDLQASGCVGTASRVIASQNVPVRTVIWLFKKPTFY